MKGLRGFREDFFPQFDLVWVDLTRSTSGSSSGSSSSIRAEEDDILLISRQMIEKKEEEERRIDFNQLFFLQGPFFGKTQQKAAKLCWFVLIYKLKEAPGEAEAWKVVGFEEFVLFLYKLSTFAYDS